MNLPPRPLKMLYLLLPCMLLLAACQTTRLESRPTGTYTDCDPALVGSWQATQLQTDGNIDALGTLDIPTGCQPITAHKGGKPPETLDEFTLSFARVGQLHLLVGNERSGKTPGMLVFRYETSPQHITIYPIDHALVARGIVAGTLPGHTEASSRIHPGQTHPGQAQARTTSIDNLIAGDGDVIATLLQGKPTIFSAQPVLMLQRVPAKSQAP